MDVTWDDHLPKEECDKWRNLMAEAEDLRVLEVIRCYASKDQLAALQRAVSSQVAERSAACSASSAPMSGTTAPDVSRCARTLKAAGRLSSNEINTTAARQHVVESDAFIANEASLYQNAAEVHSRTLCGCLLPAAFSNGTSAVPP
ncbi:hypothetical protein MTO96_050942 [Rhipicephalus appendiculatus]